MKKVFVQGLGFVGSAMATATAIARDLNGDLLYDVIGIDLPNNIGSERVRAINDGEFPFPTSDKNLISAISEATKNGNLKASIDQNKYSEAEIIIIDIPLDIDYLNDEPQLNFKSFESAFSKKTRFSIGAARTGSRRQRVTCHRDKGWLAIGRASQGQPRVARGSQRRPGATRAAKAAKAGKSRQGHPDRQAGVAAGTG